MAPKSQIRGWLEQPEELSGVPHTAAEQSERAIKVAASLGDSHLDVAIASHEKLESLTMDTRWSWVAVQLHDEVLFVTTPVFGLMKPTGLNTEMSIPSKVTPPAR